MTDLLAKRLWISVDVLSYDISTEHMYHSTEYIRRDVADKLFSIGNAIIKTCDDEKVCACQYGEAYTGDGFDDQIRELREALSEYKKAIGE